MYRTGLVNGPFTERSSKVRPGPTRRNRNRNTGQSRRCQRFPPNTARNSRIRFVATASRIGGPGCPGTAAVAARLSASVGAGRARTPSIRASAHHRPRMGRAATVIRSLGTGYGAPGVCITLTLKRENRSLDIHDVDYLVGDARPNIQRLE